MRFSSPLPAATPLLAHYLETTESPNWRQFRHEHRDGYDELSTALKRRQRGLCAFCEIDLITSADTHAREIEHWRPKSLDQTPSVRWTFGIDNLQIACLGGTRRYPISDIDRTGDPHPAPNQSCGACKADHDPVAGVNGIQPYRPENLPEAPCMFLVADDGALRPIENCGDYGLDAQRLETTIEFVGLNCTRLKNARQAILQALDSVLQSYLDIAEGVSEEARFDAAFLALARDTAPLECDDLPRFVSTLRSYFGAGLDTALFPNPGWSIAN